MLIAGSARLLIVDEPTYGQDRRLTESLMELINNFRQEGITILMITRDMRLVDAHIDRAIVMANDKRSSMALRINYSNPLNYYNAPPCVRPPCAAWWMGCASAAFLCPRD